MSGRPIKAKCWIITTIKAGADFRGQVKYDLVDCKITEEENALSVLTDKRITQQRWLERMVEGHDLFYAFVSQSLQEVTTFQFNSYLH